MKPTRLLTIIILFLSYKSAFPQWSTDPDNPGVVCNVNGIQNQFKSFSDGNSGAYVFWLDSRNNQGQTPREIYGQHFDSLGYALWEADGQLIFSHYNGIRAFDIKPDGNGMMYIGIITISEETNSGDTLRFQLMDSNGIMTWSNPLFVLSAAPSPNSILGITSFLILPINGECYSLVNVTYYGGSNGNRFTRFDENGILKVVYDGVPVGNQFYTGVTGMDKIFDESGDFFMYYATGNGSGADINCFRIDNMGIVLWGPVNVTVNTSGLNYQSAGISDEHGITFVWVGSGENSIDLFSRRLTYSGLFDWADTTVNICVAGGKQDYFDLKNKGMYYYVTWGDSRPGTDPGNSDIYAQKIDTAGNIFWTDNGIEVASFKTYIPYPMMTVLDDNSLIIDHQSTVAGFMAQRVNDDGSLPWGPDAMQICTVPFNPFYQEHTVFQSDNNTIAVWNKSASGGGADGVYITRIDTSETTGIISYTGKIKKLIVSPNPADDYFEVSPLLISETSTLSLFNCEGKLIESSQLQITGKHQKVKISVADLPSGIYILKYNCGSEEETKKIIIR